MSLDQPSRSNSSSEEKKDGKTDNIAVEVLKDDAKETFLNALRLGRFNDLPQDFINSPETLEAAKIGIKRCMTDDTFNGPRCTEESLANLKNKFNISDEFMLSTAKEAYKELLLLPRVQCMDYRERLMHDDPYHKASVVREGFIKKELVGDEENKNLDKMLEAYSLKDDLFSRLIGEMGEEVEGSKEMKDKFDGIGMNEFYEAAINQAINNCFVSENFRRISEIQKEFDLSNDFIGSLAEKELNSRMSKIKEYNYEITNSFKSDDMNHIEKLKLWLDKFRRNA
jgi:hypothetical protein